MTHSKNFEKVKAYYKNGNGHWNIDKVRDAVGRWITAAEYEEITGEQYDEQGGG